MDEADFISAEFELVPAGRARDAGIDESMIMAYGQDDRVCAYTSLAAMLKTDGVKIQRAVFWWIRKKLEVWEQQA